MSLKPSHVFNIFNNLIYTIWVFTPGMYVEQLHLKFCKQMLGVKQNCQNEFVYFELGRYPLIINRQYRIIKFWLKIIKSSDRKYIKICYNLMLYDIIVFSNKIIFLVFC